MADFRSVTASSSAPRASITTAAGRERRAKPRKASGWLLLRYSFRTATVRGGSPEPRLPLFCRLGLDGEASDHSTFPKNRHGRFRDCDLLRKLFETVVRRCMAEGRSTGRPLRSMPA